MKKNIYEVEILDTAQLDKITGGTYAETRALLDALNMDHGFLALSKLEVRLKKEFGIGAALCDAQTSWEVSKNIYTKDGEYLTHDEVMEIIRKKYPYKNIFDEF